MMLDSVEYARYSMSLISFCRQTLMNYFGRVISVIVGINDQLSIPLLINSNKYAINVVTNIKYFTSWESVNDMQVVGIPHNRQYKSWSINPSLFFCFRFIMIWKTLLLPVDSEVKPRLTIWGITPEISPFPSHVLIQVSINYYSQTHRLLDYLSN
jgi:hypothetical protein